MAMLRSALRQASCSTRSPFTPSASSSRCSVWPSYRVPAASFSSSRTAQEIVKRFTREHEWVAYDTDSKVAKIGITEYAQKSLGDVVYAEVMDEGSEIKTGDIIGAVESVKAASDIYAPVSGTISEINQQVGNKPSLLNSSPEVDGWLASIALSTPSEVESELLTEADYKLHCEGEGQDH